MATSLAAFARSLQQLGGVFMFDQKRTGLAQRMTAEMRSLAARESGEAPDEAPEEPRIGGSQGVADASTVVDGPWCLTGS